MRSSSDITEAELWERHSAGDVEAREDLIISYRPLVFWIASKIFVNTPEQRQDIVQEGMLALIKAVDAFDTSRGVKFSTYAYHKIHGAMINLMERNELKAPLAVPDEWLDVYEGEYSDEDWLNASEAVSRLEGREAEVVNAIFFEGKKPKDVAAEKSIDVSSVYRLRRSAISRVRMWLGLEGV